MLLLRLIVIYAADALIALMCIRALCTWIFQFGWSWVDEVYRITTKLTEFIVAPCRKITDRFSGGMFDWSLFLACFVVILARNVLLRIL